MFFFFTCTEKIIYSIRIFYVRHILATGVQHSAPNKILLRMADNDRSETALKCILIKSYYEWLTMIEAKLHLNVFSKFFVFKKKRNKINKHHRRNNRQSILPSVKNWREVVIKLLFLRSLWFHRSIQTQNGVGEWH